MKKAIIITGILLCASACQNQSPAYVPAESIEHYYIEKREGPDYKINFVHIDPNCKENLYYCPEIFVEKKTHWALCPKCIHIETAKEILEP